MRFGSPPHPMRPIEKSGNHRSFQDVRSLCYRAPAVITRLPLALRCKVWISGAARSGWWTIAGPKADGAARAAQPKVAKAEPFRFKMNFASSLNAFATGATEVWFSAPAAATNCVRAMRKICRSSV